jgi:hypothetical protein
VRIGEQLPDHHRGGGNFELLVHFDHG